MTSLVFIFEGMWYSPSSAQRNGVLQQKDHVKLRDLLQEFDSILKDAGGCRNGPYTIGTERLPGELQTVSGKVPASCPSP